jgi:hypothetical protein
MLSRISGFEVFDGDPDDDLVSSIYYCPPCFIHCYKSITEEVLDDFQTEYLFIGDRREELFCSVKDCGRPVN